MSDRTRVWKEGVIAGLWGAAAVALWFLVVDLVSGRPFATPEMLGRALWSVLGRDAPSGTWVSIAGFTLVHVLSFVGIGVLLSVIVDVSRRTPGVLAGLLLLFAVFQVGFHLLTLVLAESPEYTGLAWYHIGIANLLAAGLMGRSIFRQNPGLATRFAKVLDGTA